jgi:predicted amidohydrolase YtcJ
MVPAAPIRISLYHMSTEADCGAAFVSPVPESMLKKNGIKLWADGSPWVGTIASTIAYLDNPTVVNAGITPGTHGEEMMNYSRAQIDAVIDAQGGNGHQFAFHCNGDIALDIVLDAFEYGLNKFNLVGTDHRWRVEHVGAARADQFTRAASLGVGISMSPFQFIYWGDILDGTLFDSEVGAQWQRVGDAVKSGAVVSFHNDGSVSPSIPLLNLKSTVTRLTPSGKLHGPEQKVSLDDALRAQTINGAFHLKRDDESGSIEVGKFADFVILDTDPYAIDPANIDKIKVQGTWLAGKPVDVDAYLAQIESIDPSEHKDLHAVAIRKPHAC